MLVFGVWLEGVLLYEKIFRMIRVVYVVPHVQFTHSLVSWTQKVTDEETTPSHY